MFSDQEDNYKLQYTARKTVCEMLKDRKLQLVPFSNYTSLDQIIADSFNQFQKAYDNPYKWQIMAVNKEENDLVITKSLLQFNSSMINQIQDLQKESQANIIILILDKPIRNQQQINLKEALPDVLIQCFTTQQLQMNITKHFLVPKHEKLTQQQVKQFLEQNHLKKNQLQQMLQTDAMAVYLGLKKGDVVKISRILDDNEYVNYRIVV